MLGVIDDAVVGAGAKTRLELSTQMFNHILYIHAPPRGGGFLPYFCLHEAVSLHMCVFPYKSRKLFDMLLKLMMM